MTRKDTLTVSFHTFLPSETFGWAGFSTVLALLLAGLSVLGILLRLVLLILLGLVLLFLILIAFHNGFRLLILKFRS